MKVLVIEKHELIRNRINELIGENFHQAIVLNVVNEQDILPAAGNRKPDVVLIDMHLPSGGFIEMISGLKKISPEMLIIVLYIHTEDHLVFQSKQAGADYVLCKYDQMDELINILNTYRPAANVKSENTN